MSLLDGIFLDLAIFVVLVVFFWETGLWKRTGLGKKWFRAKKKSPVTHDMLRHPGQSLRKQIDDLRADLLGDLMSLLMVTVIVFAAPLKEVVVKVAIRVVGFGIFLIIILRRSRRITRRLADLQLGYDGELAAGEELNQLMRRVFYVYHDFPADKFNIDHIAIGPPGVFAIETKAKAKPNLKGSKNVVAKVAGASLIFTTCRDDGAISQARNQARWLGGFLRNSTGKEVPVFPVVALPGWFVENGGWFSEGDTSYLVLNPKGIGSFITNRPTVLTPETITQVAYQIEQKCRTTSPFELT